ncbi:MAG: PEGA domain-containing protein [Nitrospirae bacterium]|nr:PEGA domain-containing protein [Nitrospirota bacterium]
MSYKKIPDLFHYLFILILMFQMILSPYLVSAQEAGSLPPLQITQPNTGLIDIESNVKGAAVTIDEEEKGKAPIQGIRLPAGIHKVVVKKEGYKPWSEDIIIAPGEILSILAPLIPLEGAAPAPPIEKAQEEKPKVDLGLKTAEPAVSSKPFYTRWWFWTLVVLVVGGADAAAGGGGGSDNGGGGNNTGTVQINVPSP